MFSRRRRSTRRCSTTSRPRCSAPTCGVDDDHATCSRRCATRIKLKGLKTPAQVRDGAARRARRAARAAARARSIWRRRRPFVIMVAGVNGAGKTTIDRQARAAGCRSQGTVGAARRRRHVPRRRARAARGLGRAQRRRR
ncbi:MAG: hypothetical protein MZW92_69090 [Comamonadaceae bacterium]|nr:hypothetical protein [Comamonadaceae bacterium]